jgi:Family of unknown function (DUF5681)
MMDSSHDYRVGRGRPPRETRWKKGQSGNPRSRNLKQPENAVAIIDRLLLEAVQVTLNGDPKRIPTLEAILLQLVQKAKSGSERAHRALMKYQEFASQNRERKFKLTFVETDYTRDFASKRKCSPYYDDRRAHRSRSL